MATINEVAERSGVAPSTVSYVLNDGPRSVSLRTRTRVLKAIEDLKFQPSAVARGLRRNRMNTLGVVFTDEHAEPVIDPYFAGVLNGILQVAAGMRQNTTLLTGDIWARAAHGLPVYSDGRCDGLLLISPPHESPLVAGLLQAELPFVVVGDVYNDNRVATVDVENAESSKSVVRHLVALGHRRIAVLSDDHHEASTGRRRDGFYAGMAEAGLHIPDWFVLPGRFTEESGYERTCRLLDMDPKERPTAIFAIYDVVAFGAIRAIRDRGLLCPEDVSVVGFDDVPAATFAQPGLTTVRQPHREIGAIATEMLLDQIEGRTPERRHVLFPATLVARDSTGPPGG